LRAKGRDLLVACCPERIVQGAGLKELRELPQIVSGATPEAEREAVKLFERISPEVVVVSPIEAELIKLFTNAYRYIEFAATNEFYLVAKSAGVDYQRVLKAMKHHYPRLNGVPRPGFAAGPCLVKDTMQLSAFARNQFALGHSALLVNEGLVLHVVDDLKRRYDLANSTVGLLGMAFKAESDDPRESLSYKLRKVLEYEAAEVLCTDVYIQDPSFRRLEEVLEQSELLFVGAPHREYRQLELPASKPVVDIWNIFGRGVFPS
jgi:UDP-N-acetyl-D-mannosaminuronic acid dehydrogenase